MDALIHPVEVAATDPRVLPLIAAHLDLMRASSPPESVHAMAPDELVASGVRIFALIDGETALAIGALKPLSGQAGEIKSMHVRAAHRGKGLADRILVHLLDTARAQGMREVLLETGSSPAFTPARSFYGRHGFSACPPFEGYVEDPESVFMRLPLDPRGKGPHEQDQRSRSSTG